MKRLLIPILCGLWAAPVFAASPIAEVVCDSRAAMEQRLVTRLGSTRQATGLRGPEQVMEVWTDRSGDWTLVVSYASGTSCIVAMGEAWENTAQTSAEKTSVAEPGADDASDRLPVEKDPA
ncbi:hypothetical protein [Pseudooceanicola algae]|uniref:Uncharacterized protein n=1 Tax=Pseudooceanicola algae TaxID=1537215 RepID=A0A418SGQ2_9RHOB|nr:hypothetical protein [Pseudooceanicola algae]QPM88902.1 hypothetical protein PSAL_001050 [Pseudooceanicola algae]